MEQIIEKVETIIKVYESKPKPEDLAPKVKEHLLCISPLNNEDKCLLLDPKTLRVTYGKPVTHSHWESDGTYVTTYFSLDLTYYEKLRRAINKQIKEKYGLVPESTEKFIPVTNCRESWVPKLTKHIIDGPIRHFVTVNIYRGRDVVLDDVFDYISNGMKRSDFLCKKILSTQYVEDFVLSVYKPEYRRAAGNEDKKTFDFIEVEMVIRSTDASKEKVQQHQKEIFRKAIEKIEKDRSFKKYGVPVNVLKMYQFVLKKDGTLIIGFCLKGEENGIHET